MENILYMLHNKYSLKGIIFIVYLPIVMSCSSSLLADADNCIDSINVLQVQNKDLVIILDSIINHENQCSYYSSELLIDIWINGKTLTIGAIGERIRKDNSILGCLSYKKHLIFIHGKSIDKTLFEKTNKEIQYSFAVSKSGIDPGTKIMYIDSMDIADSSYSYWIYEYIDGELIYQSSSSCKKDGD
jgi:hypothetical protein